MEARVAAKYAWSSQAYNKQFQNPTIPPEMKPLDLTDCPVFKYSTGTLDARLSREIKLLPKNEISKTVMLPTVQNQHMLLALPKVAESQTTVNIAALEAPTVANTSRGRQGAVSGRWRSNPRASRQNRQRAHVGKARGHGSGI